MSNATFLEITCHDYLMQSQRLNVEEKTVVVNKREVNTNEIAE